MANKNTDWKNFFVLNKEKLITIAILLFLLFLGLNGFPFLSLDQWVYGGGYAEVNSEVNPIIFPGGFFDYLPFSSNLIIIYTLIYYYIISCILVYAWQKFKKK